jgi:hypothetical protein
MKFVEIGRAMRRARGICQATYSTAAHRLGESGSDDRKTINGILYVPITGCRGHDNLDVIEDFEMNKKIDNSNRGASIEKKGKGMIL